MIRLPALLRTPGGEAGSLRAQLEARDFFDLVLRLARSEPLDVAQWAAERKRLRRYTSVYLTTMGRPHRPYNNDVCMRGVEADDYYLIWSAYGSTHELYDLRRDPEERTNLARSHRQRSRAMRESLDDSLGGWVTRLPVHETEETVELLRALGYVE